MLNESEYENHLAYIVEETEESELKMIQVTSCNKIQWYMDWGRPDEAHRPSTFGDGEWIRTEVEDENEKDVRMKM